MAMRMLSAWCAGVVCLLVAGCADQETSCPSVASGEQPKPYSVQPTSNVSSLRVSDSRVSDSRVSSPGKLPPDRSTPATEPATPLEPGAVTGRPDEPISPGAHVAALPVDSMIDGAVAVGEGAQPTPMDVSRYHGMSDASAAVAIGADLFLVADDEHNDLGLYRLGQIDRPVQTIPWYEPLRIDPKDEHPEADIEGAAWLGDTIYWITSHGRNREGKWRPNRHRFFAMTVTVSGRQVDAQPFGQVCTTLIQDLVDDPKLKKFNIEDAFGRRKKQAEELAPKVKGLNVEGLCGRADGKSLLIAFRNPRPDGKALIVPLNNPAEVLTNGSDPEFSEPILWDLTPRPGDASGGFGVRCLEYSPRHRAYFVAAGPHDADATCALYRWSGSPNEPPQLLERATTEIHRLVEFKPEAIVVYPDNDRIQLLSDDGTLRVAVSSPAECIESQYFVNGWCEAKRLRDPLRKTFRSLWVDVD